MNRLGRALVAAFAAAVVVAIGCSSSVAAPDSETHWLRTCKDDADCNEGSLCICGTCTRACTADDCSSLGKGAICVAPAHAAFVEGCGPSTPLQVCSATCKRDGDCAPHGSALHCIGGACLAGAPRCRSNSDCPKPGPSNVPWGCSFAYTIYRSRCGPSPVATREPCLDDPDCGGGAVCQGNATTPDGGASSGVCVQGTSCTQDAECAGGRVCRSSDSFVPAGEQGTNDFICRAPCSIDPDCSPTERCDTGGHCQPRTCSDCPSFFSCTNGVCSVPNCATDKDCPGGFCVNGHCAESLGICELLCD
jgi:hypothetical protein